MLKKSILTISLLLGALGLWYFFLKAYDYSISFEIPTAPGVVYQKALTWEEGITEIKNKVPLKEVRVEKRVAGTPIELKWEFISQSDSTTLVRANVKSLEKNLKERLKLLKGKTEVQGKLEEEIREFMNSLNNILETQKVSIEGETVSPESFCVCIPLTNTVSGKAADMMRTINILADYISENNLEMSAKPRIHVNEWELETNRIKYDFCFPIYQTPDPPPHPDIFTKRIPAQKTLKAIFNGHYGISNFAWYSLLNYAERRNIPVVLSPLEVFNVNPELGGDSRYWEAEIYLPIKSSAESRVTAN